MRYELLGPLRLSAGSPIGPVSARKRRALLAALLVHADHVVCTDQLITELWGDTPPRRVQATLHVYISQLRKVLGAERIETRAEGYCLRLGSDELDAREFLDLLDAGRVLARTRRHREAADRFLRALALWRGAPLEDLRDGPVVGAFVTLLHEARLECLELAAESDLVLGRYRGLVDRLPALVAENPLHEAFHRQLMVALVHEGRREDALRVYQGARRVLHEELGLEPGVALQRAHRWVVASRPALVAKAG